MKITIECDFEDGVSPTYASGVVGLDLGEVVPDTDIVETVVTTSFLGLHVEKECSFYGYIIAYFVEDMKRMAKGLTTPAWLGDYDNEAAVVLSVMEGRESRIRVSVMLQMHCSFGGDPWVPEPQFAPFIETPVQAPMLVLFQGGSIDRAVLPELIAAFEKVLQETGVPTDRDPFPHHRQGPAD